MRGALLLPRALGTCLMRFEAAPNVLRLERAMDVTDLLVQLLSETIEPGLHAAGQIEHSTESGE